MSWHITIYRVICVNWHHGAGHGWKQHPYESSVCSITYANNAGSWAEMTPAPCFPSPVQMAIKRRKCPLFQYRKYLELFQISNLFFMCFWTKLALRQSQARSNLTPLNIIMDWFIKSYVNPQDQKLTGCMSPSRFHYLSLCMQSLLENIIFLPIFQKKISFVFSLFWRSQNKCI